MKKILYIILFALTTSLSMTACTEEEITPSKQRNSGGGISDPK